MCDVDSKRLRILRERTQRQQINNKALQGGGQPQNAPLHTHGHTPRRERVRQRHQLRRLVGRVAKHDALVAGADVRERARAAAVHARRDLGALLVDEHAHLGAVRAEADRAAVGAVFAAASSAASAAAGGAGAVAGAARGGARDRLEVDARGRRDLAEHEQEVVLDGGLAGDLFLFFRSQGAFVGVLTTLGRGRGGRALASQHAGKQQTAGANQPSKAHKERAHLGVGVLLEARVEHGVRHAVAELVGVALGDRLGREEEASVAVAAAARRCSGRRRCRSRRRQPPCADCCCRCCDRSAATALRWCSCPPQRRHRRG